MRINESNAELLRADPPKPARAQGTDSGAGDATPPTDRIVRPDRVEISNAGRVLAGSDGPEAELSPERVAEIRARILDGAYDTLQSVDHVARRIIASGDL